MSSVRTMAIWDLVCKRGDDRHKTEYRQLRDILARLERENASLAKRLEEAEAMIRRAVPTINVVERLRDIRATGYPRKSEETHLCEQVEAFSDMVRNWLENQ